MKIERINDNQIRCTLNKEDLVGQEMLLNELAFSPDKAKGLFRELMSKASAEVGFDAQDNPLMVEAIPVNKDCLILVITKVDPEDQGADTFKRVSKKLSSEIFRATGEDPFSDMSDDDLDESYKKDVNGTMKAALADSSVQIYLFHSLDEVATAAKLIQGFHAQSCLYKDSSHHYYLSVRLPAIEASNEDLNQIHAILSEYCSRLTNTYATTAFFKEHLTTIIEQDAIETMANY